MTTVLAGNDRPPAGALPMTPARILTLVIGVPVILAAIGWTGFSLVSQAARGSFPVSYALAVQHGRLAVGVSSADITVRPDDGPARLAGTVHYGLSRPQVTSRAVTGGDEVTVQCPLVATGHCGLSATLEVPRLAELTLSSGGGNITVPAVAASVDLTSEGGNVSVSGSTGAATVLTGGGNLTAAGLSGPGKFTTDGGDVSGDDLSMARLQASSGGGNVNLVFTAVPVNVDIVSDGGDVDIVLPRGAVAYRVSTTADGGDDSVSVPTSSSAGDQITVNSGGGNITIGQPGS
jgi:hypothetical protein